MKYHFFLFSTTVIYVRDKLERQRHLNVMVMSDTPYVTRQHLNHAQQQAQIRFFKEFDAKRETKVVDVFIACVSNLGHMTEAEFSGEDLVNQHSEAQQAEEGEGVPVEEAIETKVAQIEASEAAPSTEG